MSDRLAASRARKQRDDPSALEAHEMTTAVRSENGMPAFYDEISSIQDGIAQFNSNVKRISELHSRSLSAVGDSSQEAAQLDNLTAETRALSNSLKQRIAALNAPAASPRDAQARSDQAKMISERFMAAIQEYQKVEQQYRAKYKERVERQFKIVKPNATPEEVAAVVDDQGGENQIFAQALSSTTRYGESRVAYREVQERHQDIRRMEQTLAELAQLFSDMGTIVEQQDFTIKVIEESAAKVEADTHGGYKATTNAVESARRARKMRWICFCIILVILAAVGIGLAIRFAPPAKH